MMQQPNEQEKELSAEKDGELHETQRILRHQPRETPFTAAIGDEDLIQRIDDHIKQHIGPVENVFHEIISDLVHVDIMTVPPAAERPYWTLVTCGMSALPMNAPPDLLEQGFDMRRAELMLCLPPDWNMKQDAWNNEANYWPIRWLKVLARLPHEHKTWLSWGHTIPHGNPPKPFAKNTALSGVMLANPVSAPEEFAQLETPQGTIHFFSVLALHADEMDFKLRHGAEALLEKFIASEVSELLDIARPSCVGASKTKPRWKFW